MKVGLINNIANSMIFSQNVEKNIVQKRDFPINITSLPKYPCSMLPQMSFGRILAEHKSWGAVMNDDKTVNFKMFTYPDTQSVYVELMNPESPDICRDINDRGIKVVKSSSGGVSIGSIDNSSRMIKLTKKDNGIFETKKIPVNLKNTFYRFVIVNGENDIRLVKDPYSKEQPSILGWSKIHNPDNFKWTDKKWMSLQDKSRVTRLGANGTKGVNSLRIYEMNIPTVVEGGDFKAAIKKLDEIKEKNYANAVEIMPVENTYSKQWGYDGVDKFAVNDKLGGSKGLKEFINHAHSIGLSVIIDMVPNHIGPDGDMLSKSGPYSSGNGAFGAKFNYEGKDSTYVRDFVANMALNWAGEYHVDGLRLDMTNPHLMGSDLALKQIVTEIHEHYPDVFMIAEDGANNREKITAPLKSSGSHSQDLEDIENDIRAIQENRFYDMSSLDAIGFDSEWDFPLMNMVVRMTEMPYNTKLSDLDACLKNSSHRVAYSISHDEIGNLDGTSSVVKYATKRLALYDSISAYSDKDRYQRAAHATYDLLKLYLTGELSRMPEDKFNKFTRELGITRDISKEEVKSAYEYANSKLKLALGTIYSIPGPKMYFQGAEDGRIDNFQFFRKLSDVDSKYPDARQRMAEVKRCMDDEKGYDTDFETAMKVSTLGYVKPSQKIKVEMGKISKFTTALNNLMQDNAALQDGVIKNTICFENEKVHAVYCVKGDNEIFAVKNYSDTPYSEFKLNFPEGIWEEVINSDDKKYSGSGEYNNNLINSDGTSQQAISISDNSVSIFKRVG